MSKPTRRPARTHREKGVPTYYLSRTCGRSDGDGSRQRPWDTLDCPAAQQATAGGATVRVLE